MEIMTQCSLIFETSTEMEECIDWCKKRAIRFNCPFLDNIDDPVADDTNVDICARGLIFNCEMSRTDFLKFKMRWSHTIIEQN